MTQFRDFALDESILRSLDIMEYKTPSPIQEAAIPIILAGDDLIALAHTGSGKTAACAIPLCQKVDLTNNHIQMLVIVPTRELAQQYAVEAQRVGATKRVKVFAVYGGESADIQQSKLRHGVHILVATPGRLIDFIYSRSIDLNGVQTLVLDEADEMLSMGFYDDIAFIMNCILHKHQTLLFSATMPKGVQEIARTHMREPKELVLQQKSTPSTIAHRFVYTLPHQKEERLASLLQEMKPSGQSILFCRSRIQCEKVCRMLQRVMPGVDLLHAGLSQELRSIITNKFRSGKLRFLVATDVASRGLDFAGVTHVWIYEVSEDPDLYIHRSGRTGRYEREGMVISFVSPAHIGLLSRVEKKLGTSLEWIGPPPPAQQKTTPHTHRGAAPRKKYPPRRPPSKLTEKGPDQPSAPSC